MALQESNTFDSPFTAQIPLIDKRLAKLEESVSSVTLNEHFSEELQHLRHLVDERDRLYSTQFKASEVAVNAALAAAEKAVQSAFSASEKAITKAEEAQKDYNNRSNEFRGQLDDQNKMNMPRAETYTLVKSLEDKISNNTHSIDARSTTMQKQVDDLMISRANLAGKASQESVNLAVLFSVVSTLIAIFAIVLRMLGH